jgi:glycosyltransferase involved in cell wall biosynthesis
MYACHNEASGAGQVVDPARAHIAPFGATVGDDTGTAPVVTEPFVLFLGRLAAVKRIDVLIQAFASVASDWPGTLVIAGIGDESLTADLHRLARRVLPEERIKFVGHVEGAAKNWLLRNARAFVLCSENESFALSAAESLVAGTPVLVTPHVALSDLVERYGAGLVVPLAAEPIAAGLCRLLHDDALRATLAQGARSAAETELGWNRTAAATEEAYIQILHAHQRGRISEYAEPSREAARDERSAGCVRVAPPALP